MPGPYSWDDMEVKTCQKIFGGLMISNLNVTGILLNFLPQWQTFALLLPTTNCFKNRT